MVLTKGLANVCLEYDLVRIEGMKLKKNLSTKRFVWSSEVGEGKLIAPGGKY